MVQNGIGVVLRMEANVKVHGTHIYPPNVKVFSKHSNKKNTAKNDTTGTKRKSDALKLSAANKAIVEVAQWEHDELDHDYTADSDYENS